MSAKRVLADPSALVVASGRAMYNMVEDLPIRIWSVACYATLGFDKSRTVIMLRLPLWFVTEREQRFALRTRRDNPAAMIAFTTTDRLTNFLAESGFDEWKINLACDREGLVLVIAIAHNKGLESICIDPSPNGSGGEQVSLNDLMAFAQKCK